MLAEHANAGTRASSNGSNGATSARLGGARADFVAGLGRKVADLRTTLGRVKAADDDVAPRDELRRKLHALASAAKMMKFDAMDRGIAEALGTLDRASRDASLDEVDLDAIEQVIEDLPALAWGDGHARSSRAESAEQAAAPKYDVLVVGTAIIAEALLDDDASNARAQAAFRCESTPDTQAAYELARTTEPDLVVLDADLAEAAELAAALMDDPLTESVPIVVVGSFLEPGEAARYVAMGVAKTVSKPTSREILRGVCEETISPDRGAVTAHAVLGDPTLEELGDRLAAELREAIVGRADPSARGRRIPLGQGTEVLGAVWGAIARVREVVTSRSDGAVRFAGGPEGALTPAPLLHEPDVARGDRVRTPKRGAAAEVRLEDRRVVVADDDPGVVWFLADLLKTAGCVVHEAFDGQQALELAYKSSPDLVISDILMPNVDGFSLCRALRRDVALRDTPVILLSWKEDLLQRVRELGAGAAGYVRKESDTRAIIARVREALRARGRIEARLREDGEVRGRLDGVSIRTLLEIVCATRLAARVSVRDATFLYEVEIRAGAPHRATRTDGKGGFLKGPKVLAQLLGVSAGRFTVTNSTSPVDAELEGNLAAQLAKPIAKARAAISLLTGTQMNNVARLRFDDEAVTDYLEATPERARLVVRRLANGASPRELLLCGGAEPALLDDLLCDLASRGLVVGVEGRDGEDMLVPTITSLLPHTDARASFAPTAVTPAPLPAVPDALDVLAHDPSLCASEEASAPICTSPTPGSASLEDAVLHEMIHHSPEPLPPVNLEAAAIVDMQALRARVSPVPPACEEDEGTPPAEQILALAEPTVVEDTVYAERVEAEAPGAVAATNRAAANGAAADHATANRDDDDREDDDDQEVAGESGDAAALCELPSHDLTPFASVTASSDEETAPATAAAKRKKWPMIAFVAATGVVAWAVLHFSTSSVSLPPQQQKQLEAPAPETTLPPPASTSTASTAQTTTTLARTPAKTASATSKTAAAAGDKISAAAGDKTGEVFYTPVASGTALPTGHGVIDVSAPADAIVLVDGKERARGSAKVPAEPGSHDVRVRRDAAAERAFTIDVRTSRIAHVRFE
ncbi:MAG: response regulator [Labilithrix sp.]|nr:response regulator [Labilithrix sp.]